MLCTYNNCFVIIVAACVSQMQACTIHSEYSNTAIIQTVPALEEAGGYDRAILKETHDDTCD